MHFIETTVLYIFFMYDIQHCFICRHSDSTVSEDAGIEPRTVATTALASDALTTRIDLIHTRLDLIHISSSPTFEKTVRIDSPS